jgi:hypothetical protein
VAALGLILVVGNQAGLVCVNCSSAMSGVKLESESWLGGKGDGTFRFFISWVIKRIVVTGEDTVEGDSRGIGLSLI